MDVDFPVNHLEDKDEDARVQIAQRTGTYLERNDITDADRRAAELIARALAADVIERVRCELSNAIRQAKYLPRDLALKLAHDVDSVACPFLEVTEVFSESDWQQLILTISRNARVAVARRFSMTETVAQSLAELGDAVVAETLAENPMAPMTGPVCHALMDRFPSETWISDKLALRKDLTSEIVIKLTLRVSSVAREKLARTYPLSDFIESAAGEAENASILGTVGDAAAEDLIDAVETLQAEGKLRPLLVLTAFKERRTGFIEAALFLMAERSLQHVRSVIHRANQNAVKQLLERADVPQAMHQDFWDAIQLLRQK